MHGLPGLKKMRQIKGLTQKQLSIIVGMHSITISRYELAKQNARPNAIEKLAKALGCKEIELLFPGVSDVSNCE